MKRKESFTQPVAPKQDTAYTQVLSTLRKLGFEMVPVIAGILIALFIDQLQDDARDEKLLQSTLQSLSNEFTQNAAEINKRLLGHKRLIDTLHRYQTNEQYNLNDVMIKGGGFQTPTLLSTNWQITVNNNGLRFMNFQTVNLLSRIQAVHREIQQQEDVLFPVVYGSAMYERDPQSVMYRRSTEDLIIGYRANEQELLDLYKQFKELVQAKQYLR